MDEILIVWTETAISQRNNIFKYWNERTKSLDYSSKVNRTIQVKLESIKDYPGLGRRTPFTNIRVVSMGYFSLFYKTVETKIIVMGFWDNRQNPTKLSKLLKNK